MGWLKPTGHNDPDSKWENEIKSYDNNTGTYALTSLGLPAGTWSTFLELTHAAMSCSKVRFWAWWNCDYICTIDIDAYYGGTWNHVYEGVYTAYNWIEKSLASIQTITAVKFRFKFSPGGISPWLNEVDFYECVLATVTTQAVSSISSTTATGNGNITAIGSANATKRGVCWNITGSPTIANSKAEETGSFGTGAFTRPMTGLSPGVKYYVKAYAYNEAGYSYGAEVNFTTLKVAPTVTTQLATEVSQNHVKGNGNITALGGENATERGFEYGLTKTATWTKKETGSYGIGAFYLTIENLQANTAYWYRAYAVNSIGTGYGEWVQFQTSASGTIPLGTKISICSDYSGYTYKLNSALTDDGETYESFFVLSTDLAGKQGLHINKRLEDIFSYFTKKESGIAKIYIKQDNEAEWNYAGEVSMTGDEDIVIPHLPVDSLAKHFLIKFLFISDFEYIGSIFEFIPIGTR